MLAGLCRCRVLAFLPCTVIVRSHQSTMVGPDFSAGQAMLALSIMTIRSSSSEQGCFSIRRSVICLFEKLGPEESFGRLPTYLGE